MAFEQRDNSGSLFRNEGDRKRENGPDYSGKCMVGGVEYFFDGWIKAAESGRKWMSFSFKPTQKQAPKPEPKPRPKDEKYRAGAQDDFGEGPPF